MIVPLALQTAVFLRACLLGVGAGLLWDLLRGARAAFRLRKRGTAVLDGLFCLLFTALLLLFLLLRGDGSLRIYIPVGAALGFTLWRLTLSRFAARGFTGFWRLVRRAMAALGKGIVWLFSFPRGT